ncbi:MAG: 7-cyano-7-deazaguanine synthase QueC [Caulobacterales bacterium]
MPTGPGALVLFSGGQDSATCLAWALSRYAWVETVCFNYGQRHAVEIKARDDVRLGVARKLPALGERLGPDHLIDLTSFGKLNATALTSAAPIQQGANGLPSTFVPGRNLAFLTYAAALAWGRQLPILVGGMCETDYSGYPDCRRDAIDAMQTALRLGMAWPELTIETPLMSLSKAQTWEMAESLGGERLIDIVLEHSHTCYLGDREHRHAWGYGCGDCPACTLRANGWTEWRAQAAPA